ncbi:unnamed protein product [Clavelina lepadiformis]|uniref:J domain-containing protein n=1 Tax=Clavelina lepadiformis TaxID=159417 RepID=A0ABP0H1Y9_CLALP
MILIMAFLDEMLSFSNEPDYYDILGCNQLSNTEQIVTEYRLRAKKYHPDKNLDDPNTCEEFVKLQIAKETLTDPVKRKDYDTWKNSGLGISYQKWKSMRDSVKTSMHWAVNIRHEPMIESSEKTGESASANTASTLSTFSENEDYDASLAKNLRKFRNYEI